MQELECVDTDFLATATSTNQLYVLFALLLFPSYKTYRYDDIRKFEISTASNIGPILVMHHKSELKKGIVFLLWRSIHP